MKKRTIWTILALMLIGLLGIIIVQVYWLARASALEQSLFKEHVHRALNNVARQLEIKETKALIMQSLNDVRKTAEAAKLRRTMPTSRKAEPLQITEADVAPTNPSALPRTAPLVRKTTETAKQAMTDSSAVTMNKPNSNKSSSSAEKNAFSKNNAPFLSVQEGSNSFEMHIDGGNVSFNSSRESSSSRERSSGARARSERSDAAHSQPAPNVQHQMPPQTPAPPQGLVVTIPTGNGQPFRFFIPNGKANKRDSILQRFRRASGATGAYSVYGSKTLEDKMSAAERGIENPSSGSTSTGSTDRREVITKRESSRDAQREIQRFNERQLSDHFQREFAKSQQQIERLRRMQGVNTRDLDSLFNMAVRQTWQDMASFGFEMRMMPFGSPMNPPPPPEQPSAPASSVEAAPKSPSVAKKYSAPQPHRAEQSVAANKQKEAHAQNSTEPSGQSRDTISKIIDKIDLIGDILENMGTRKRSALERVPLTDLDALLAAELRGNGVNARYEYGILHGAEMPASVRRKVLKKQDSMLIVRASTASNPERVTVHASAALRTSEFRVQLFPNDILGGDEKDYLTIHFPDQQQGLTLAGIAPVLGSSALFLMLIMGCFGFTLLALVKQKKLSDMKTDFINNMTHELKTPIATISIASEALKDNHVRSESVRVERFVNIIHDENKRLAGHVEKVLQAAQMDRGELNLKLVPTNVHQLIETVAESLALQLEQKQGRIELRLEAHTPILQADEAHFRNVIVNLLDNANKYTPDAPHIIVSTRNTASGLAVTIQDNGIGMTREAQKQIFEKFYRVPTGNRHDVKGFGLGLNYVKTIVEAHGGTVSVKSEQSKGSTFEVMMPLSKSGFVA